MTPTASRNDSARPPSAPVAAACGETLELTRAMARAFTAAPSATISLPQILKFEANPCVLNRKSSSIPSRRPSSSCGGIFDWDSAQSRLAEFNKRAEDPKLWNDPRAAQKIMRQRQQLERSINAYKQLERESRGQRHADRARRGRGRRRQHCRRRGAAQEARRGGATALGRGAAVGRGRRQRQLRRGARGRRRHREPGLGLHADAHVHALGAGARLQGEPNRGKPRRRSGPQIGDARDQGRERLRLAEDGIGRAPAGAHLALRRQRAPPHELCLRVGLPRRRRGHRHPDQRERLPRRYLPLLRCRRAARQHDQFGGTHHAPADRHRGREPAGALADQEPRHRVGAC